MASEGVFEVKVNRLIMLCLMGVASVFILAGLDLTVFHKVLDFPVDGGKRLVFYAFLFVCFGLCGLIVVNLGWYSIVPPTMLRLSPEGVAFGTGFRYRSHTIPWKHLKRVGYGVELRNLTALSQLMAGVRIEFEPDPETPSSLVTSAGISYCFHVLQLDWKFMDRFPPTVVKALRELGQKYGAPASATREA